MATPVIMPKFEMTQETGKVLAWLKNEGETVQKGDALLEVETDKVNQEVESPATGTLAGISARPGEVVPIATPIAYILKQGESLPVVARQPAPSATSNEAPDKGTPSLASTDTAHPKAAPRAVTPLAARLAESHGLDLNKVSGTGPLGRITREDVEAAIAAAAIVGAETEEAPVVWDGKVRAVPAARRLARELGIDLHRVTGTGPEGRVQPADVTRFSHRAAAGVAAAGAPAKGVAEPAAPLARVAPALEPVTNAPTATTEAVATASVAASGIAVRRVVALTNIRKTIAERMTASVREAPQFTVSLDVDMGRAQALVEDLKVTPGAEGKTKITLTAVIVKACAWALRRHPEANASWQGEGQGEGTSQGERSSHGIVEWDEVNVGVATAIDQGLIVPVVRGADALGLRGIAARMADLTGRARDGKLKLDDLTGGTFTVSNLGMFGIDRFTAILNPPQAAILAVGRVAKRAEVVSAPGGEDRTEIRPMAALTLTADHRVLDGATAAKFLATIKVVLEHPGLLLE